METETSKATQRHPYVESTGDDKGPVSLGFMVCYMLAALGLYLTLITPVVMTLAIRIAAISPDTKAESLGYILGVGAFAALIANPLFGRLSDQTRTSMGRRKPWLLGGIFVSILALYGIGSATSLVVIGVLWVVVQFAANGALAALVAIVPDQVPERQRGIISAFYGVALMASMLLGVSLVNVIGADGIQMFIVPAFIGGACVVLFCLVHRDYPAEMLPVPSRLAPLELLKSFWINPVEHKDFSWAWLSRFLLLMGKSILTAYQVYYLIDHIGIESANIAKSMLYSQLVMSVSAIAAAFLAGWLSDYFRRRKLFVFLAALIYTAGMGLMIIADTFDFFLIAVMVSSVGLGVYLSVDQALVVDILPSKEKEAAKNMGIFNIANVAPQSLAPAIAPLFLGLGSGSDYVSLFAFASVMTLLGAFAIMPVRGVR